MSFYVCGVDPGRKGSLVVLNEKREVCFVRDFDELTEADLYGALFAVRDRFPGVQLFKESYIRAFSAANAAYEMGRQHGVIDLATTHAKIPCEHVRAIEWQRRMFLPETAKLKTKEAALFTAEKLYPKADLQRARKDGKPSKVVHDGRVDALLIASYGLRLLLERELKNISE